MTKRVSVREVAHAAGLPSVPFRACSTVRAMRARMCTLRVQQAVARLGYEPDYTARHLRTGHSRTIGCLLPSIANRSSPAPERGGAARAGGRLFPCWWAVRSNGRATRSWWRSSRTGAWRASSPCPRTSTTPSPPRPSPPRSCPRSSWTATWARFRCRADRPRSPACARSWTAEPGPPADRPVRHRLPGAPGQAEAARLPRRAGATGLPFDDRLVYLTDSSLESARQPMQRMLGLDAPPTRRRRGHAAAVGAVHVVREAGMDIPRDMSVVAIGTNVDVPAGCLCVTTSRTRPARGAADPGAHRKNRAAAGTIVIPSDLILGGSARTGPGALNAGLKTGKTAYTYRILYAGLKHT